jgi:hypothetical protein
MWGVEKCLTVIVFRSFLGRGQGIELLTHTQPYTQPLATIMTREDKVKVAILIFAGFLNLLMSYIVPVAGGGASLILALTVPITASLSLLASGIYYWLTTIKKELIKNVIYYMALLIILLITFIMFPYKNASIH